jgi:hypothetical protein
MQYQQLYKFFVNLLGLVKVCTHTLIPSSHERGGDVFGDFVSFEFKGLKHRESVKYWIEERNERVGRVNPLILFYWIGESYLFSLCD